MTRFGTDDDGEVRLSRGEVMKVLKRHQEVCQCGANGDQRSVLSTVADKNRPDAGRQR
jgi:hypothetical protein